jgi:hypothetical protein
LLQSLTGLDQSRTTGGRMRIATLWQRLLVVPGRLTRHARGLTLRHPPHQRALQTQVLQRLRALPAPT